MAALFGSRVRRLRTAAGLTQEQLGARTHVVGTRITQVERSSGARPTQELARALDEVLGADGLLIDLWPYVYREAFPDWSRKFMELSARAASIREYAAHVVPGLLQTEEYAHAVLSVGRTLQSEEHLAERVEARLQRQERLAERDRPELWVVLDEAVLRRPVGGTDVMRRQLRRLREAARDRRTTVQVLPFRQGQHDSLGGSMTLLTMPDREETAYLEGSNYGRLVEEPAEVQEHALIYDRLRAAALPPVLSLDMIRAAMEGTYRGANVPTRSDRRRVAQQQLQQPGGWQLRGGGRRAPRRGPRS
ncbi:helix-turn-helix transcriptional regulator [Streptomyces sp. DSM 42041]|uniref:Helix-turn-helix transcriptional regulator n=1 Tax=Streptomyces hazeniae TaxID=3075538 RepID=A0ABU2NVI1_9ACTN|nr:helix-turn-helix transcriptional regulator [Streptomyces sp. DSM 42041]MDT0380985.1 helix-turn-helix transcriptional regulator [Streptomyces sp. DSM 42041]